MFALSRLEILKCLCEYQLDKNESLQLYCQDIPADEFRQEPAGLDFQGNKYWSQVGTVFGKILGTTGPLE